MDVNSFMADVVTTLDAAGLLREGTGALASQTVDQIHATWCRHPDRGSGPYAGHREGAGSSAPMGVGEYPWGGRRSVRGVPDSWCSWGHAQ